jgi:hypothetical protein
MSCCFQLAVLRLPKRQTDDRFQAGFQREASRAYALSKAKALELDGSAQHEAAAQDPHPAHQDGGRQPQHPCLQYHARRGRGWSSAPAFMTIKWFLSVIKFPTVRSLCRMTPPGTHEMISSFVWG